MKMGILVACLAMVGSSVAWSATNEPIQPIRAVKVTNPALVELGKKLYFDPRLSKSGFISCNSCHNLSMGGSDNLKTSIGHNWQKGPINSPTVLNSSLNVAQFWDGRAADLKEQAAGPVTNPKEMGAEWSAVLAYLSGDPTYVAAFAASYPAGISQDAVTDAIAEFEKTLVTPSRYDAWLRGDDAALTAEEQAVIEDITGDLWRRLQQACISVAPPLPPQSAGEETGPLAVLR